MSEINNKKKALVNVRAKLSSLKALGLTGHELNDMEVLQRNLQKQNKVNDSDMEKKPKIPQDEIQIEVQNRLWSYFEKKIKPYENKVEKQRLNSWSKWMDTIIKQTDKKIDSNYKHKEKVDWSIKCKYKQTHELFGEIEKLKKQKSVEKLSRRKKENIPSQHGQKKNILKENIQSLNEEIEELNEHKTKIQMEISKITKEKLSFLQHLLHQGFYRLDGVQWILTKMKKMNYKPNQDDFPPLLDKRSKAYLLEVYQEINESSKPIEQNRGTTQKLKKRSASEISLLAKPNHLKDVYKGTKQYLLDWVKKAGWKEQVKLPKITRPKEEQKIVKSQVIRAEHEKNRIGFAYRQQVRQKVMRIEFGLKIV